ncbi:phage tail tape measure protein [Salmonella enterica subsp. enterica serovar Newport]|uniref:Phage tail tape measure protein n=1 Tax=Salmonella enterica I TaxID=59201 RepID=A0A3V2NY06_SALET|nr:phage tail tape measure protein [Salmonella enterica subsp. enterica serovar Newport]EEC4935134.1 phage tail tape measure protein [Salmonella enterica subsp. enterica serovar Kasenyi]EBR9096191.1 phage tail tape measure protein [Salmonella enterica subsp. enterica serovar Newport]EBS3604894.1 phage tail tape measure protein [Salmonella enterica subsp. enterica serovar Newport]EBU7019527.1 phage tail tape measure protein [Salmonella enterica subsp. enterica serovar Newport]
MSQQRLELLLELTDRLTKPLRAAGRQVQGFAATSRGAFRDIATGGAALWGVGAAIQGALMPAIEMDRALGEVKSLGVAESGLRKLSRAAVDFTMEYGGAAQDFVRASYDIQSAIAGLTDDELSRFTAASATVAAATKSSSQTITAYMGTMYGIFKDQADAMGKSKWVEQVAGQTATAVQMFKTTGDNMSAAFTSLGASAKAAGIDAAEQFAVLGQLQATMSGSEAGTKYKAFLAAVGGAQKKLGLNFVNKDGTMKSVVEIMKLIRGKFGDLSKVADSDLLKKAFGSDEAVAMIKLLSANIDGLEANINTLGNIKGMDKAVEMAQAMADPWEQAAAIINGIRIEIGTQLLPVLYPFIQKSNEGGKSFVAWLRLYPNITRAIGLLSAALIGVAAVGATVNVVMGVAKFIWVGLRIVWMAVIAPLKLIVFLYRTMRMVMLAFCAAARMVRAIYLAINIAMGVMNIRAKTQLLLMGLQRAGMLLQAAALSAVSVAMGMYSAVTSGAAIATQLLFSPITLIILALAALGVGIYFLITRWDEIKAALMDTAAFQWVAGIINSMGAWFGNAWSAIQDGWNVLVNYFSTHSPLDALKDLAGSILNIFSNLWELVKQSFSDSWGWIVDKLNMIPGVNIDTPESTGNGEGSVLTGGKAISAGPGGIAAEMQNNSENQTTIDNSRRVVNVNVQDASPARLNEWMELHAY